MTKHPSYLFFTHAPNIFFRLPYLVHRISIFSAIDFGVLRPKNPKPNVSSPPCVPGCTWNFATRYTLSIISPTGTLPPTYDIPSLARIHDADDPEALLSPSTTQCRPRSTQVPRLSPFLPELPYFPTVVTRDRVASPPDYDAGEDGTPIHSFPRSGDQAWCHRSTPATCLDLHLNKVDEPTEQARIHQVAARETAQSPSIPFKPSLSTELFARVASVVSILAALRLVVFGSPMTDIPARS